jgi:GT2 family glycosyltransferase
MPRTTRHRSVTAVVLTCNRRREVTRTVSRMAVLPERPPLIVVDNGSSDGTAAWLRRRFPQVQVLEMGRNLGAAARNAGAEQARTPYVAFCDDDTWWQAGALRRAQQVLDQHPRIASLTARVLVGPRRHTDPISAVMQASPLPSEGLPGPALLGFLAGASVFRRSAFLEAGGYEPRYFIGAEEALLALDLAAAGWDMVYLPELVVHHHPSRLRDPGRRRRLLLRNELWTAWLRRPCRAALRRTAALTLQAHRDGLLLDTALAALAGLPWIARRRQVIPPQVERMCRMLE